MKIRGRKETKLLALLLCQCMAIGMFSMNVYAGYIPDIDSERTLEENGADNSIENNNGTITNNYGTIRNNYGTIRNNYGTVE